MWKEILELALTNGIWSALFVGLLIFQLKDSAKREKKYQD
ncbi:MAG: bacteriocin, partial [Clostridia bacterium]|nr:bacteriocin [Clostridia bacterium]